MSVHATTSGAMRPRSVLRLAVRAAVLAMVVTLLPPVGVVEVSAHPVTLSEEIEGLPAAASDRGGDAAAVGLATASEASEEPARSGVVDAPLTFSAVGFEAPVSATELRVRTSVDGVAWSAWQEADLLGADDGPDAGTAEYAAQTRGAHSEPVWVGEARYLQVEVAGASPDEVAATVIDSMGHSGGPVERRYDTRLGLGTPADASMQIVSRAQWGADESLGSATREASAVHMGIVHHTAHTSGWAANNYSQAEAAGIMRAMHRYHTVSLGWADLGYNVVIDRFGTVYEGRKGGFERGISGAHASGFNTGSFGVSVIGNFADAEPSAAALASLTRVIGVKSAIHGIDPTGVTNQMSGTAWRPTIVGHRDVGQTTCPGRIHAHLAKIRQDARQLAVRFPDVPSNSPHRPAILGLAEAGVTTGCRVNEFCPTLALNRAQASSFVVRALELTPIPGSRFPDVGSDGAHTSSINVLVQNGWMLGFADGTFGPWEPMTRGQLATLLARSLGLSLQVPWQDPYPDVPRTSTHAPAIAALKDVGIQGNCGSGNFCPHDTALRDSTASFVAMVRAFLAPPPAAPEPFASEDLGAEQQDDEPLRRELELGDPNAL